MEPLGSDDPEALGRYRLVARLGAGGMGRVYLARSPRGRAVAIKVIRPELIGDRNFRIRFRREVEAAGAIGGSYAAPVLDADPDAETPWLATEFIPGPTLTEAVAEHGPLPLDTVLALGAGVAEALIAVQAAGLVHRDLKPSNVLLAADGPRVIDFGIVRASDGYDLTQSGALFGSFAYMCPEQATGDPMGPEGDIFSLGSVLAFAATGHAPFTGAAAATMLYQVAHNAPDLTDVPEPLDKIISLCLAKDPRLRITADRLAAACAPAGTEQALGEGWLPAPVTGTIARRAATVTALRTAWRVAGTRPPRSPAGSSPEPEAEVALGALPALPAASGEEAPIGPYAAETTRTPDGGITDEKGGTRPPGADGGPHRRHRSQSRSRSGRPGLTRRALLAASATAAVGVGGGAVLLARNGAEEGGRTGEPLGPPPEPVWTFRGDPMLQAPAAFSDGTALLKTRPGDMLSLDVKNGSRPKWVYRGVSQSSTPVVLVANAAVALGEGATVIGVNPADGSESFTMDFGSDDYRFDTLLGVTGRRNIAVLGVRLQRRADERGVATATDTVFDVDLAARRASVVPIKLEDAGIELKPIIVPGYFIYTDGLHNVTARNTYNRTVRWQHPMGADLRTGLALLGLTVFALGRGLEALDLVDGKVRWQARAERGQFTSLGASGTTVYVTGTDPTGVYAFEAASGERRWFCPTPPLDADQPVTTAAKTVFVTAHENQRGFYAIDAIGGRLLWNFTDARETGVNDWQLAHDGSGRLVAHHYDRVYGFAVS